MTLEIEYKPIEQLLPYARNSRTHSDEQVAQIAASIREFGWTNPILVDGSNGLIAGHGRLLAARKLGMDEVPCIELGHLSETQRKALVIADNKLALNAGWDAEMLALEVSELAEEDFDLSLTGFSKNELASIFGEDEPVPTEQDTGIDYEEKFAIVIECASEADQTAKFDDLTSQGFSCRVLVN